MTLATVTGAVVDGVRGLPVRVEVDVAQGLPSVGLVGLAGATIWEARGRVRAAIGNAGLQWPASRVTIGLSPASIPKAGTGLDLAIAVGLLQATGQLRDHGGGAFIGELGLDGSVRAVTGILAAVLACWRVGIGEVTVSAEDAALVSVIPELRVRAVASLGDLVRGAFVRVEHAPTTRSDTPALELSDVRGHDLAKFGIEVAAAGGHHCALTGPPGVGKSMLAARLAPCLPDLDDDDAVTVTGLQSLASSWQPTNGLVRRPVVQAPHHSASAASVLGTVRGSMIAPGAITLAHLGVLVMDEAPEFNRAVLEGMRQPLESGSIALHRVGQQAILPAEFQLVATANPCPCGQGFDTGERCSCTPLAKRRYAERLSGPLLDRVDVRLELTRPVVTDLHVPGDSTKSVRERVQAARERAAARLGAERCRTNARVPAAQLQTTLVPDASGQRLLERALLEGSSMRGLDRVLRMAWTIADLAAVDRPGADEVALALTLRGITP